MEELANYRSGLVRQYQVIAAEIEGIAEELTVDTLEPSQEKNGWTLHQVFSHIRDVEKRFYLPYFERFMVEEKPELGVFDDAAMKGQDMLHEVEPLQEIINDLIDSHTRIINMLQEMQLKDWNRTGRHQRSGIHTMQWYLEQNLAHLKEHINQMRKKLNG